METRYNKEYRQYYIYALEQFLIKTYGFSEHDARIKVMQDYDEVKEDFERKNPLILLIICLFFIQRPYRTL